MLYKEFVSIFFCLWQKITSSLLLRCTVKQPLVCFICFLLSAPPPFSLWLSLVAGLFLLSPAMMAPHLAVGTMRNDKMGEPCFYLMGQNQTTVCSQKSVPLHSPCHRFPFSYIHPFFQPIPPCIPLCVRVGWRPVDIVYKLCQPHLTHVIQLLYANDIPTHVPASDQTFINGTNLIQPVITRCCHLQPVCFLGGGVGRLSAEQFFLLCSSN